MRLVKTNKFTEKLKSEKLFDTYAIAVYAKGEKAFLYSDNADENTYFDIASMGKVLITSTLILKAIGENKLSPEDTIGNFFENVPSDKKDITVEQLLTHTSGIVRCFIPREIADQGNSTVAEHIINNPLAYKPGEGKQYSCNAFILLGFILEKIYNMPLDKLFYEHTKKTLNLTHSKFNIAVNEKNAAISYHRCDVGEYRVDDENVYNMHGIAGSGAQFWTLGDIVRFCDAIMAKDERLYPKEIYDLAEKSHTGNLGEDANGWGWLVTDERYKQTGKLFPYGSFGHCGHTGTSFFFNRKEDMYVVILTNATRWSWIKHNFETEDYSVVCKMRENIHNMIAEDFKQN